MTQTDFGWFNVLILPDKQAAQHPECKREDNFARSQSHVLLTAFHALDLFSVHVRFSQAFQYQLKTPV